MQSKENVQPGATSLQGKPQKDSKFLQTLKSDKDKLVIGWDAISEYCPYSKSTLKQKYSKRMRDDGFVFRANIGDPSGSRGRSPMVWSYPSFLQGFFVMVAKENEGKI